MPRRLALLLALLLLATACAADGSGEDAADVAQDQAAGVEPVQPEDAAPAPQPAPAGPTAPGEVPETLAFTATTIDGAMFEGGDYAGRDLMLWFWAPW